MESKKGDIKIRKLRIMKNQNLLFSAILHNCPTMHYNSNNSNYNNNIQPALCTENSFGSQSFVADLKSS